MLKFNMIIICLHGLHCGSANLNEDEDDYAVICHYDGVGWMPNKW